MGPFSRTTCVTTSPADNEAMTWQLYNSESEIQIGSQPRQLGQLATHRFMGPEMQYSTNIKNPLPVSGMDCRERPNGQLNQSSSALPIYGFLPLSPCLNDERALTSYRVGFRTPFVQCWRHPHILSTAG